MSNSPTMTVLKSLGLATVIVAASGCANNQQIEEANNNAQQAMEMAQQAMQAAEAANNKADAAMSKASEAEACCQANQNKLDKMFERSQYK